MRRRPGPTGIALIAALVLGGAGALGAPTKLKGSHMSSDSIYPTAHGSPRRDSFIAVDSRAKGTVAWARDLGFSSGGGRLDLLLLGGAVVVSEARQLALFSPEGKPGWTRQKQLGSPAAVANGLVYYESEGMYLEAVDAGGKQVVDEEALPGVGSADNLLSLLWPREKDYIAAIDSPDPRYDEEDPDAKVVDPSVAAVRSTYGNRINDVTSEHDGVVRLPALFIPEKNRWLVGLEQVVTVDLTSRKTAATPVRFAIPVDKAVAWSADGAGILAIAGEITTGEVTRKAVVALDLDGKERWRWLDTEGIDAWVLEQPPVRAPGERVLVLTSRRVLSIEHGKLVWAYDLLDEAVKAGATLRKDGTLTDKDGKPVVLDQPGAATALADGTLLFTAGNGLRRLDSGGHLQFVVRVPAAIVSPPLVDAAGNIYVATATQLVQIR